MFELLPSPKNSIYLDRYIKFISYYLSRKNHKDQYLEKHHILPKSLFPQLSKEKWNIVLLTPRQHFLAHYMLWKAYRCRKTHNAFRSMRMSNKTQQRITSRLYDHLKKEHWKHPSEQKEKISKKLLGIKRSEETKKKMSAWQKGKSKLYLKGLKRSEETKKKMSAWQKGKSKPCITGSKNGMSKPTIIGVHHYGSIRDCSLSTGLSAYHIRKYINFGLLPEKNPYRDIMNKLVTG